MSRMTVDYGIDLGTTNSGIAVLEDTEAEVIRNNENSEIMPSVVHIDKGGNLIVGRGAYERLEVDPGNTIGEFKLRMGSDHTYRFDRDGRVMTPEALSAEVLKSLRSDVQQRKGEDLRAAVISVPAAFELPQCDATRRAAELAGLAFSPLVQEPVAAAMAYGFQKEGEKAFWLVYDLGGGTFDAAVIQVRDGLIQVVNHEGDNNLGGKLIDWAIVEELLVPAVKVQHSLEDFRRGNPKWQASFAKLKWYAEKAKIQVSRADHAEVQIESLLKDDSGASIAFEFTLKRSDVERLMEPFVARTIDISRKVLTDKALAPENVERVILVGGPTLTPYLRERLKDKTDGLGIDLDFSVDPLTVVAQGAAIFAGTQQMKESLRPTPQVGEYRVELEYKAVGPDTDPLVGGKVIAPNGEDLLGHTIEFVNESFSVGWRSGKVPLNAKGSFTTELRAEKGKRNIFRIYLFDGSGTTLPVAPDQFTYTVGLAITDPPLIHSVGVALANNQVQRFFKKGSPLPVRGKDVLHTTEPRAIRIPVVEGESPKANRNKLIGHIEIPPERISRDVPAGSEVEVKIEIDKDRIVHSEAFVPILDVLEKSVLKLVSARPERQDIRQDLDREKERLARVRPEARTVSDTRAAPILGEIERQNMVSQAETSLAAGEDNREELEVADQRVRELQVKLDELEESLAWPALVAEAESQLVSTREVVQKHGDPAARAQLASLERELREAIARHDEDVVRRKTEQLKSLTWGILVELPAFWISYLQNLEERRGSMRDQALAGELFARGARAIQGNDLDGLRAVVRQLNSLLPVEKQISENPFDSTVMR